MTNNVKENRFSFTIRLSYIFGFRRNVGKDMFGAKQTIVLIRKATDNQAIWQDAGVADAAKVTLSKVALWMR